MVNKVWVWLSQFNKLYAAALGIGLLWITRHYNIAIPGLESYILEAIISAGTVFGVYRAKNGEKV